MPCNYGVCRKIVEGFEFAAIHASPPCQKFSSLSAPHADREYPDLIGATRELLLATGLPYVIENVPQAPLRKDLKLCGSMFGLGSGDRYLMRHRIFELEGFKVPPLKCNHKVGMALGVYGHGRWSNKDSDRRGGYQGSADEKREAMGIDWMNRDEVTQAVPPAYTEYIGKYLMEKLLATE
jgi:DNA (cytosine-5)-methyltransferase 1